MPRTCIPLLLPFPFTRIMLPLFHLPLHDCNQLIYVLKSTFQSQWVFGCCWFFNDHQQACKVLCAAAPAPDLPTSGASQTNEQEANGSAEGTESSVTNTIQQGLSVGSGGSPGSSRVITKQQRLTDMASVKSRKGQGTKSWYSPSVELPHVKAKFDKGKASF